MLALASITLCFVPPHVVQSSQRSVAVSPVMKDRPAARGFGPPPPPAPVKQAPKAAPAKKDKAAEDFDKLKATGAPSYEILIREVPEGGSPTEWMAFGSMAVPRSSSEDQAVSMAIFNNEDDLLKGAFKIYPKLKVSTEKFEYGYRLQEFPDDPIKVASEEKTQVSDNPIMQWFSQLDSPLNKD